MNTTVTAMTNSTGEIPNLLKQDMIEEKVAAAPFKYEVATPDISKKASKREYKKKFSYAVPIADMITRVKSEPRMKMVYSGIKENSVGFIFGPSKCAKTIFCENLGMSIAAGCDSFLGKPINLENKKVLFISLEEFYAGRTERNEKQVAKLVAEKGDAWLANYMVMNENIPRYLMTDDDWKIIYGIIVETKPGIVFIDSLSRMYNGSIEDSSVAKDVMQNLREMANAMKTTIVVIHHTPKLYNSPLTINSIAGSRMIAQDADFMIGLNKTIDGKRYVKDVAFRYAPDDCETVRMFTIGEDLWLNISGDVEEFKLLSVSDGRRDDNNKEKLLDFIAAKGEVNEGVVLYSEIEQRFVKTKEMSSQTAHVQLNSLEQARKISKPEKGKYKLVA